MPDRRNSGLNLRIYNNLIALQTFFSELHVLGFGPTTPPPPDLNGIRTWASLGTHPDADSIHRIEDFLQANPDTTHLLLEDPMLIHDLAVTQLKNQVHIITDMHNVESQLRFQISQAYPKWRLFKRRKLLRDARAYQATEDTALATDCRIWACSHIDRELLLPRAPERQVDVVPNVLTEYPETYPPLSATRLSKLLYVGTYAYYPNRYAARYLCQRIVPGLRKHGGKASLHLLGHGPKPFMLRAARKHQNVHVPGEVSSVKPFLQECGVMVMPIFQGGGTRLKAIEACLNGLVIVSTAKGVEGLGLVPGRHYFRAETRDQFLAAIESLETDPETARTIAAKAYQYVRETFTMSGLEQSIARSLEQIN